MSGFIDSVSNVILEYGMLRAGQTVVVAVSGGPDSTALLHALASLRKELQIGLIGAHLNHGFRGEEADLDAEYVRELCRQLGVPSIIEMVNVPERMKRSGLSAQVAARIERRAFLMRVAEESGAERIALGHNRNDRVETVLLNLFRGTGLEGLSPLPEVALPLIRPLIHSSRAEIETFCLELGVVPRYDSSNSKNDYRRNRMRSELLPYLAEHFNPKVGDALLRLASLANDDDELLESMAKTAYEGFKALCSPDKITLSTSMLLESHISLQRRILRIAVADVRGDRQNLTFDAIENVLSALRTGKRGVIALPSCESGSFLIRYDELQVSLERAKIKSSPISKMVELSIPGQTLLPGSSWSFETVLVEGGESAVKAMAGLTARHASGTFERDSAYLYIAALNSMATPLALRFWKNGDRMRPKGMSGTKKLQDIFIDRKLPVERRHFIPLLVENGGEGEILAAIGVQSSEMAMQIDLSNPNLTDIDTQKRFLLFANSDTYQEFDS